MERLQKIISSAGIASRRKAEELIKAGKVFVNGKKITELGFKASGDDEIVVDGIEVKKEDKVYYLLNKPRGIISSAKDEHDRTTVVDLIKTNKRIYPIGRLDYDTTGLLLLTNDGELANLLMHPKNNITKRYVAKIEGTLSMEELSRLKKGLVIEDRMVKPERVKIKKRDTDKNTEIVEITIIEGRNHIVKKIFQELNHEVLKLKREGYAFLTLDGLKSGEYRELSIKEVKTLYSTK